MKKYLKVMLVLIVALSLMCTFAFAAGEGDKTEIETNNKTELETNNNTSNSITDVLDTKDGGGTVSNAMKNLGSMFYGIVRTAGYIIAIIMVLVVGIQWLIGTPAKKQELKGKLVNVIIGAVIIILGVSFLGLIEDFAGDMETKLNETTGSLEISTRA